jgi:amino acid adenylation domain-containing protein
MSGFAACHETFARIASSSPDVTAVTCGNKEIGYGELNRRADRVAATLVARGVRPQQPVGLSTNRAIELVVGMLGILKAGAAYVPLDPCYPYTRLNYIAADCGLRHVLADRDDHEWLPGFSGHCLLLANAEGEGEAQASRVNSLPVRTEPGCLAYVIYTSGSTGVPKGTLVTHGNLSRLFTATRRLFEFTGRDIWSMAHSYSFDFSVWEIWGALVHGGRLVIVPRTLTQSPADMLALLRDQRVTVLSQTPSAFYHLARADADTNGGSQQDLSLRYVIFGGEALSFSQLRTWMTRHGDSRPRLVNMYGITETTVHATVRPISLEDVAAGSGSMIGHALPDLRLHVLDDAHQPVAAGQAGELYVGGAGVAVGYLNRPGLTAARFVPDPWGPPGDRMYRSGDLVRRLGDNDLEYVGRTDDQVNLRGFRIELGEIEAALLRLPGVDAAVVLLRHDRSGEPFLAAHVATQVTSLDHDTLRDQLAKLLPDYMVPHAYALHDTLPVTVNGKVDRSALPDVYKTRQARKSGYAAPRNRSEQLLARAWADVLDVESIGIDDNFYALGGDSIRSIQVLARARQIGIEFELTDLLREQSVRRLAPLARNPREAQPPARAPFSLVPPEDRRRLPTGLSDAYPLTSLQAGMLYHSEFTSDAADLASGGRSYQNVTSFRITGPYSADAWRSAAAQLIARHDILRTSFDLGAFSVPLQLVHRAVALDISFEDLRSLAPEQRLQRVEARLQKEVKMAIDWQSAPMIRFHLQRLAEDHWQLLICEHHAILDGWSERSLLTELFTSYGVLSAGGQASPGQGPAACFRDYVELEAEAASDPEQRRFWADHVAGGTCARLPRLRPGRPLPEMRYIERPLDAGLDDSVSELAANTGVPVRIVLLAAHLKVLATVGNTCDVISGVVYNGRTEGQDGDKVAGVFLNTLPLRVQMEDDDTWTDLLRATARIDLEVQPYRRFPLAEISRDTGPLTLFEAFFNFTSFGQFDPGGRFPSIRVVEEAEVSPGNFAFGAEFMLDTPTRRLRLGLRYDAAQFDLAQIELFFGYYQTVLRAMTRAPAARHQLVSVLSEVERRQISAWNATGRRYPQPHVLHELVEQQTRQSHNQTALRFGDMSISYAELDTRASHLARRLSSLGVQPRQFVGVCLDRSIELIVAMLGVLKAGAAYVPIAPGDPAQRVADICADAGLSLVLCDSHHQACLGVPGVATEVVATARQDACPDGAGPVRTIRSSPDDPSYMIFTSGSTGRPKGAVLSHRAVSNRLLWMQDQFRLAPGERILQKTPVTFDVSVWEVFWPLIAGGCLVIAAPGGHRDPAYLRRLIADESISTVHFVPSMLQVFLDDPDTSRLPSLTRVICSGEALGYNLQEQYTRTLSAALYNLYGPTEAAIDVTWWKCGPSDQRVVPIGRPIANIEIYVLSAHGMHVPAGVTGELHIAGAGLADGYWGRPELTAERFVTGERPDGSPVRLYRTGDLGRFRPDGVIEFLGRTDSQVKIRGQRVELTEIEAVLAGCSLVRECAVIHRDDRLAAYVVPRPGERPAVAELAAYLRDRLPSHLVPSLWHWLEEMPLTSSGKLDRKVLPSRALPAKGPRALTSPRDEHELRLLGIWAEMFGHSAIDVHDSFFDSGGDSLSALRLLARIRHEFGIAFPLSQLLEIDTVSKQSSWMRAQGASWRAPATLVPISPQGGGQPLFFIHPAGGNVFCYRALACALKDDRPVYGVACHSVETNGMRLPAIEEIALRYLRDIRRLQESGPYYLAGWSLGGLIAYQIARALREEGVAVGLLALLDTSFPAGREEPGTEPQNVLMLRFAEHLCRSASLTAPPARFADLGATLGTAAGQQGRLDALLKCLSPGILPADMGLDDLNDHLQVFTRDLVAAARYRPQELDLPMTFFESTDSPGHGQLWRSSVAGKLAIHRVPADHYAMMRDPAVLALAKVLDEARGHHEE